MSSQVLLEHFLKDLSSFSHTNFPRYNRNFLVKLDLLQKHVRAKIQTQTMERAGGSEDFHYDKLTWLNFMHERLPSLASHFEIPYDKMIHKHLSKSYPKQYET